LSADAISPWEELRAITQRPFLVLDTETTGLTKPEAVAVAVVDHTGTPRISRLVRPAKAIEPDASAITGIDAAAVAAEPEFPAIEAELTKLLANRDVAIYNAHYDTEVLRNTYRRYGLPEPAYRPWCVMKWFARVYGDWDPVREGFRWKPLRVAAEYFGVAQDSPHDALDDCLTTWRVLMAALKMANAEAR